MDPTTFPFMTPADDDGVLCVFRKGTVSVVLARIVRMEMGWAGRVRCRLKMSVGEVTVTGNRETIPLSLNEGDWVRVRVMRTYSQKSPFVMRMMPTGPDSGAAWLPTALCHRTVHLERLRALLAELEPAMQATFMAAMTDAQVQRRLFWRVAAGDHHCYPGGLFDQSVKAAELAFASAHSNEIERSVATMGALLFDLGKVFDDQLTNDGNRIRGVLLPHRLTRMRLQRAYDVAEAVQPGPAALLRAVLEANPRSAIGGPPEAARLAHCVRSAVERAFGLESHPRV